MFIRKTFTEFLTVHSDARPAASLPERIIDWRWFEEEAAVLPAIEGERPTIRFDTRQVIIRES